MAITIIGYRGTGKTTVGAELAQRLDWDYIDIDPELEKRARKSIAAIFAQDGEPYFRDLESAELARHLTGETIVVSAGGGVILRDLNRDLMCKSGPVIWLMADEATIAARIQSDPTSATRRPSLTRTDPISEIQQVLAFRRPLYSAAATIQVQTDGRSPAAIVDEIMLQLPRD